MIVRVLADGEAQTLRCFVEIMAQIQISPAIGDGNGLVHFDVQFPQLNDVSRHFKRVMEEIVGFGQPFLPMSSSSNPCGKARSSTGIDRNGPFASTSDNHSAWREPEARGRRILPRRGVTTPLSGPRTS